MAEKSPDTWLQHFKRDCGIKSSVILSGNVQDIMLDPYEPLQKYASVLDVVIKTLKAGGAKEQFQRVIVWDSVSGVDSVRSDDLPQPSFSAAVQKAAEDGDDYDFDDDEEDAPSAQKAGALQSVPTASNANPIGLDPKDPKQFLGYLQRVIASGACERTAFILDFSDYLFGAQLDANDRAALTVLSKTLFRCIDYSLTADFFAKPSNCIIILTRNAASIPPSYYVNNALVSFIAIPLPGRPERERFIAKTETYFNIDTSEQESDAQKKEQLREDFIDALDGFTLKEIAQLAKLSRQLEETLTYSKLINLYRYGEKVSPWEELNRAKLEHIADVLKERVKGQDEAVDKVRQVIFRAFTGFAGLQHSAKQRKPKGTLFFVGPTGVGKTELAKAIAAFIFGDEDACIRFDMSEFSQEQSDQRLIGAPPGYVGYEEGGQLTNAVKAKPFCVLLFDEIEKAHPRVLDKFLQILEDGRLTDGKGETVSFSETIIIFTSNIGASEVPVDAPDAGKRFVSAVQLHFREKLNRPELLNRIGDNIIAFNFITQPDIFIQIAQAKFKNVEVFMKEHYKAELVFAEKDYALAGGVTYHFDKSAAFSAVVKQVDKSNGGRGLLNALETYMQTPLADFVFCNMESLTNRTIVVTPAVESAPQLPAFQFTLQ